MNSRHAPRSQKDREDGGKSAAAPLVYSTDHGEICPDCGRPVAACCCRSQRKMARGDGKIRISRETKGRKGAGVTVVSGLPLDAAALADLARELKKSCGCGGAIKDGTIEIQGDHRQKIQQELLSRGWQAKQSGG